LIIAYYVCKNSLCCLAEKRRSLSHLSDRNIRRLSKKYRSRSQPDLLHLSNFRQKKLNKHSRSRSRSRKSFKRSKSENRHRRDRSLSRKSDISQRSRKRKSQSEVNELNFFFALKKHIYFKNPTNVK
jgi:hypothetical protein